MKESLYQKLIEYNKSGIYPFCMPGHKRNFRVPGVENPYDIDITEVDGFDNYHDPSGIIKDMQKRLAEVYSANHVYLSVNGSSAGMLAAVSSVPVKGELLVARNCHKSVFDGLSINGRKVHYLYPEEVIEGSMIYGGIDPEAVEKMLSRHSRIKAVVITSPTYEGFLSDVQAIAEIAHKHEAILVVDEAHGAHLPYHDSFPVSAIYLGADIVVQSLHKTLPSLNQTALVFVNGDDVLARRVERALSTFTTTSPSYGLLASCEYCVEWCVDNEEEFNEYVEMLKLFRERYKNLQAVDLIGEEMIGQYHIFDVDPSKLTFVSRQMSGAELGRYLLKEHKLQMEAAGTKHVLAMTSVMDTENGFERLYKGLASAAKIHSYPGEPLYTEKQLEELSLLYLSKVDRVFKDFIYLYPPGCPIIAPGEVFTLETWKKVREYIDEGLEVIQWERSIF